MAKINFKNFFSKFHALAQRPGFKLGANPHADWKLLVYFFIVLNFAILAGSIYMFRKINKGEIFRVGLPGDHAIKTIDRKSLQEVLAEFNKKAEKFKELKNIPPGIVDPSL